MAALRILLVDDHILFRKGLARLLDAQPDLEVVGEAADGLEAVERTRALRPEVVLMDLRMPECDGLEATRRIKQEFPATWVVMLGAAEDDHDLVAAIRCGADGFLVKDMRPEQLYHELRGLARGEAPFSRVVTGKLLRQLVLGGYALTPPPLAAPLSTRERQVLTLLASGLSNAEIAVEMGISANTVRNHVCSILSKLHLRNRVQAAVYAARAGLFETR